ncbi:conserved protein of unknown function [Micropruina glycogenica]|uniref:Uncharacterized protein n=1 Tax=Micropruina glycogenica TaxID=75385 RepID=A0A2N9JDE1_9ACTN|nr:conserved protein of unknown function [Micropruina glycogenica]
MSWSEPRIGSGQREEKLLQLRGVHAGAVGALGQALAKTGGDHGESGPVERFGDRRQLGDDVGAMTTVLDHANDSADLTFGAAQPLDHPGQFVGVELHRGYPLGIAIEGDHSRRLSRCPLRDSSDTLGGIRRRADDHPSTCEDSRRVRLRVRRPRHGQPSPRPC